MDGVCSDCINDANDDSPYLLSTLHIVNQMPPQAWSVNGDDGSVNLQIGE